MKIWHVLLRCFQFAFVNCQWNLESLFLLKYLQTSGSKHVCGAKLYNLFWFRLIHWQKRNQLPSSSLSQRLPEVNWIATRFVFLNQLIKKKTSKVTSVAGAGPVLICGGQSSLRKINLIFILKEPTIETLFLFYSLDSGHS